MKVIIFIALISSINCISLNNIITRFKDEPCIEDNLHHFEIYEFLQHSNSLHSSILSSEDNKYFESDFSFKSTLSTINEIAQLNKIDYYYYLEDEQGPAHDKVFTVALKLGNENYQGVGKNLKDAKGNAGAEAILHTNYKIPELKEKDSNMAWTPTVKLNNLATKLGMKVTYLSEDELIAESLIYKQKNITLSNDKWKTHLDRLNYTIYHPYERKLNIQENKPKKQSFKIGVTVGDMRFIGLGYTLQAARHDAANKALTALNQLSPETIDQCLADGILCNPNNIKSPTSLIYEMAQKQKIRLEFEVIAENGAAHAKEFVTKCQYGDLIVEGNGKSKKVSKKDASEKMLELLKINQPSTNSGEFSTSVGKKKKNKIIKGGLEKFSKDAKSFLTSTWEYFNPVDDKNEMDEDNINDNSKNKKHFDEKSKKTNDFKRALLGLTQERGITVQYVNLGKENTKFYSLLFLGITPNHICLGYGISFDASQQKASLEALNFCHKLGIENLIPNQETFNYLEKIDFEKVYVIDNSVLKDENTAKE